MADEEPAIAEPDPESEVDEEENQREALNGSDDTGLNETQEVLDPPADYEGDEDVPIEEDPNEYYEEVEEEANVEEAPEGGEQPQEKPPPAPVEEQPVEPAKPAKKATGKPAPKKKTGGQGPKSKRYDYTRGAYPYRARYVSEGTINAAIMVPPEPHEYFGFVFSADSDRAPGYYHNYFLPVQRQPEPRLHLRIVGSDIPAGTVKPANEIPRNVLPLSSVKVKWCLSIRSTVYKPADIYAYLTRFGPVECVFQLTPNSALVVFYDLEAAQAAVSCPHLGTPWGSLIATWHEPRLHNYGFYSKYRQIEESPWRFRSLPIL